jgi:hypothetical protein
MKTEIKVEVKDVPAGFRFRLVSPDGRSSRWCDYRQVAKLADVYAATDFLLPEGLSLVPVSASAIADAMANSGLGD